MVEEQEHQTLAEGNTASEEEAALLDLNSATAEELTALSGIGPQLARRIVAYREERGPFILPEEVVSINGIGPNTFEQFAPHVTAKIPEELPTTYEQAVAEAAAGEEEEEMEEVEPLKPDTEPQPEPTATAMPEPEQTPPPSGSQRSTPPEPQPSRRWPWIAWGIAILGGGLLGMVFALLVFAGINGTLDIAHSPAIIDAQTRLDALEERAVTLEGDVDGLRRRLSALEGLTARMDAMEENVGAIEKDVNTLEKETRAMQAQVQELEEQLDAAQDQLETFYKFFTGLRTLLTETFGEEATSATPVPTSTPTPEPSEG